MQLKGSVQHFNFQRIALVAQRLLNVSKHQAMLTKYSHSLYPWHIGKAASRSWMYFTQCLVSFVSKLTTCTWQFVNVRLPPTPEIDQMFGFLLSHPDFSSNMSLRSSISSSRSRCNQPIAMRSLRGHNFFTCFPVEPWSFCQRTFCTSTSTHQIIASPQHEIGPVSMILRRLNLFESP